MYIPEVRKAPGPATAAYLAISFAANAFVGIIGLYAYLRCPEDLALHDRMYGFVDNTVVFICNFQFAYQLFNLVVAFACGGTLLTPQLNIHHVSTMAATWICLKPLGIYYACFFAGLPEMTNMPLAIMDFFKLFPAIKEKFPTSHTIIRAIFAVSFIAIRNVMWAKWSILQSYDWYAILPDGDWRHRGTLCLCLFVNLFLTGLQLFWGFLVARGLLKAIARMVSPPKQKIR